MTTDCFYLGVAIALKKKVLSLTSVEVKKERLNIRGPFDHTRDTKRLFLSLIFEESQRTIPAQDRKSPDRTHLGARGRGGKKAH